MASFTTKKFSLLHVALFSVTIALVTFGLVKFLDDKKEKELSEAASSSIYCNYNIKRMSGLKFVKPILWVDEECESDNLAGIKQKLTEIIEKYKQYNGVTDASVYLRSSNKWTVVNEGVKYQPGSLFKVPILITILKMNEEEPGFLNKVIPYNQKITVDKQVMFPSKSIEVGQSYTVKELLTYMIKYSDNAATMLLEKNMKSETMQKLFKDVGVEVPNAYADQYLFTVKDYSLFMRTIFNAGYLSIQDSEYAAELLSECEFKDGLAQGVPANTKMAHKFGEAGDQTERQLHESAIIFLADKGYLLTVMTKGKDMKKLSQLLGEISRTVYEEVKSSN